MAHLAWDEISERAVDTARVLAADAVEKVASRHLGTALGLAPRAYLLDQRVLRHDPLDKDWAGRERFILSAGHSSLTQYVQLYLGGFGSELSDLTLLLTWVSKTPGHPAYVHTDGVEVATWLLGQGLSAVRNVYAARCQLDPKARAGKGPFDHHTYVIASDGDLQAGATSEASSLAEHQELGSLVVISDWDQVSIEDDTDIAVTDDVAKRYEEHGGHVQKVGRKKFGEYVEDAAELYAAIGAAKAKTAKPSITLLKTIIGWPVSSKQNTGKIHGSALGGDELVATKKVLGWSPDEPFVAPDNMIEYTRSLSDRASAARAVREMRRDAWADANPERKALRDRVNARELPGGIANALPALEVGKEVSTRAASGAVLNTLAAELPELWGGSADLAESNLATIKSAASFVLVERSTHEWSGTPYGRVLHFGMRGHAMGSILNGIVPHGPTRAFGGTFLIFSGYTRLALRLGALMNIPSIFVWTHDSAALCEDGRTQQPIEQFAALRAIPNFTLVRPGDAAEAVAVWLEPLRRHGGPAGIVLTRRNIPVCPRSEGKAPGDTFASADSADKGPYVFAEVPGGTPDVILITTGSEALLAVNAREVSAGEGVRARADSAPSLERFDGQDAAYRESVLSASVSARVSVEAGIALPWRHIVGDKGRSVSIEHFGASTGYKTLFPTFSITTEAVVAAARETVKESR